MLYVRISNGIAVYPFRTMNQRWKDQAHRNIDVHRWPVQLALHKLRAAYIERSCFVMWCLACLLFISFFLTDSDNFICRTEWHTRIFLQNRTKIDTDEAVSLSIDACKLISLYMQLQRTVISKKLQPLSPLMTTPNRFRSKVCIRKTHMVSAFSNEPPHRIGSGATQTEHMYMQMAMRSTAEWGFGRPTSFACNTGHARTSMFSIYGQGWWHIKSMRKRSADLRSYFKTWR